MSGYTGTEFTNKYQRVCNKMLKKGYDNYCTEQTNFSHNQSYEVSDSLKYSKTRPTTAQSFFGTKKKLLSAEKKFKVLTLVERMADKQIELSNRANFKKFEGSYYLDMDNQFKKRVQTEHVQKLDSEYEIIELERENSQKTSLNNYLDQYSNNPE